MVATKKDKLDNLKRVVERLENFGVFAAERGGFENTSLFDPLWWERHGRYLESLRAGQRLADFKKNVQALIVLVCIQQCLSWVCWQTDGRGHDGHLLEQAKRRLDEVLRNEDAPDDLKDHLREALSMLETDNPLGTTRTMLNKMFARQDELLHCVGFSWLEIREIQNELPDGHAARIETSNKASAQARRTRADTTRIPSDGFLPERVREDLELYRHLRSLDKISRNVG